MAQITTKVGTFEVEEIQGKCVVSKNGKYLAVLKDVYWWDKDAIVKRIEANGKRLKKLMENPLPIKTDEKVTE